MENFMIYIAIIGIVTIAIAVFVIINIDSLTRNFASSMLCNLFVTMRHSSESVCKSTVAGDICFTDAARMNPLNSLRAVPLIGCGSKDMSLLSTDQSELSRNIGLQLGDCWNKYGKGEYNVLWIRGENPAKCSTIYADIGQNHQFTAEDLTYYFEHANYSVVNNCLDRDEECCDVAAGYECDTNIPSDCIKGEDNPWVCESDTSFYKRCLDGFTPKEEEGDECITALKNFMCDDFFYYDDEDDDSDGITDECKDIYETLPDRAPVDLGAFNRGTQKCKYCESSEGVITLPLPCTLRKTTTCTKEVTYAEYLGVGGRTVYSFKNDDGGILVEPNDTTIPVTGKFSVYIYFIDSFTGTRKDAEIKYLPDWCATTSFMDSCSPCPSCLRAGETGGVIGLVARSGSIYKAAEYLTVGLIYDTYQYYILGYPTTLTGIPGCVNCISAWMNSNNVDMAVCTDKMIVCIEDEPEV
jgi:hypothetical protein